MRKDLNKVLTERPRKGSGSRNLKTGFHENGYDNRESREDHYSLPKIGKMKMHNRENGPYDDTKEFSDLLGPLHRWIEAQVGRNWDKVYSDIRNAFPNSNKQNHHLIDTHLMGYINRNCFIEKVGKVNKVFELAPGWRGYEGKRELSYGEIYVDPHTNVLKIYKKNKRTRYKDTKPKTTLTGYHIYSTRPSYRQLEIPSESDTEEKNYFVYVSPSIEIHYMGNSWVLREKYQIIIPEYTSSDTGQIVKERTYDNYKYHNLSKKELVYYGLKEK
jgi:hypothetical protein